MTVLYCYVKICRTQFVIYLLYYFLVHTGPPREFLGPRAKGNLPPPPILQIMILRLSPPRCVISKESVQQKWIDEFRDDFFSSYLTGFSYFPLNSPPPPPPRKLQDTVRSGQTGPFKRGCRCFQLCFIDFQLFYFLFRIIPANCDLEKSFLLVYLFGPLIITHGPRGAASQWAWVQWIYKWPGWLSKLGSWIT